MEYSVKQFEMAKKCHKSLDISRAVSEECRPYVMAELIDKVCQDPKSIPEKSEIVSFLEERYSSDWFSLTWQRPSAIENDYYYIIRFLSWFNKTYPNAKCLKGGFVSEKFDDISLTQKVNFIFEDSGESYAVLVHYGKTKKSLGGRSQETNISYDLATLLVKRNLEELHPHIKVMNIYLQNENDTEGVDLSPEFVVDKTKKSSVFTIGFENYYYEDTFDYEQMDDSLRSIVNSAKEKNCDECRFKDICDTESISNELIKQTVSEDSSKVGVKGFTVRQKEAIDKNGPTLICAGPGSGKTATIVGKIKRLIDDGVSPSFILCLSFTNEAVKEMKERVEKFCSWDVPTISTINALAYSILNEQCAKRKEPRFPILTDNELKSLIKTMLSYTYSLDKVNIYSPLEGKYGLLNTLSTYYKEYKKEGVEDFFAPNKHTKCGAEVLEFLRTLDEIINERHFITYDEQITLCLELLKNNPDVLNEYRETYQYILVDEFQDINGEQAELIYLLAEPHNNLTVVGDDDQAIYGWRGGSNVYMLEFSDKFGTSPIVLDKNFRSVSGIVTAAESLISMQVTDRIEKKVDAVSERDEKPVLINDTSAESIECVVKEVLESGKRWKDIVILARTNKELEDLKERLSFPCELGKNYLVKNPLFKFLYYTLEYLNGNYSKKVFVELFSLWGLQELCLSYPEIDYRGVLQRQILLPDAYALSGNKLISFLEDIKDTYGVSKNLEDEGYSFFISCFNGMMGINDEKAPFAIALSNLQELYNFKTMDAFCERLSDLMLYGDETKMNIKGESVDEVRLLTFHESKGMEFPVVIMLDDGKTNYTEDSEGLNLLYVGLTRPKEKCFFMSKRYLAAFDEIFERR